MQYSQYFLTLSTHSEQSFFKSQGILPKQRPPEQIPDDLEICFVSSLGDTKLYSNRLQVSELSYTWFNFSTYFVFCPNCPLVPLLHVWHRYGGGKRWVAKWTEVHALREGGAPSGSQEQTNSHSGHTLWWSAWPCAVGAPRGRFKEWRGISQVRRQWDVISDRGYTVGQGMKASESLASREPWAVISTVWLSCKVSTQAEWTQRWRWVEARLGKLLCVNEHFPEGQGNIESSAVTSICMWPSVRLPVLQNQLVSYFVSGVNLLCQRNWTNRVYVCMCIGLCDLWL